MKKILIFLGALAAYGQTVSLSDTLTNAVGGGSFTGRITVTLSAPGSAQPLYYSTTSLTGWQAVYCLGVTGSDCTTTTAAGVFAATLYANSTITPAGTSYSARFTPAKGSPWSEVWVITPSTTTLRQVRSSTVPTPTTTFQASQIVPGSNGQVLTTTAGASAWGSVPACATCVVTSGSYANPAWLTSLAGSKVSGAVASATTATTATSATTATALAANGTNCAAGTFPLGVDASGNSESCTALPTTISGTANQITASASTGAVTLSLPATITGLTSVSSTGFTGALTGNASTATALASTVASGRLWIGQGTGVPTSDAGVTWDSALGRLATANIKDPTTNNSINLGLWPNGTATQSILTLYNNSAGGSAQYAQFTIVGPGSSSETRILTGANTGTAGDIVMSPGGTERMRWFRASGNVATGTATDLGYGLHAANKGTNGNLLVFDPTATTGTTKAVFAAGQGQSGNLLETRLYNATPGSGLLRTYIDSSGYLFSPYFAVTTYFVAQANDAAVTLRNSGQVTWVSNADATSGTRDTSLSRASAGVLQVGDGGANANGYLSAARLGVGTASPASTADVVGTVRAASVSSSAGDPSSGSGIELAYRSDLGYGQVLAYNRTGGAFLNLRITSAFTALTQGNVAIGGTTDGNYKLDVANSGSSGTLRVYDQTATTGNTKEVIRAGAGQSTNLTEWQNNAGTVLASVSTTGTVYGANVVSETAGLVLWLNSTIASAPSDGVLRLTNNAQTSFGRLQLGGTTSSFPALKRSSAILQARLADDSAYTDIGVNAVIVNKAAPSASSDACTAGQLWAGDMGGTKYAFYCVASGTIVRSAFASF